MTKKDTTELKLLGEKADFFVERTFSSLIIEICDLIIEILEEAGISELTLKCDSSECAINGTKVILMDNDDDEDIFFMAPDDSESFLLRDEDIDLVYGIFQHVTFFAASWDGNPAPEIKIIS